MMIKIAKLFTLITLITVNTLLYSQEGEKTAPVQMDSILASVNGEPIVLSDILFESERDENVLAAALNLEKAKEIIMEMRKKLVDEIINRKLIIAEYERGTFRIPEEYINNAIDDIAKSSNFLSRKKFYQALRSNGMDLYEFREKIREKIIVEYLIGKTLYNHVNISPKKLYEYYQANKETEFTTPDKFELSMIFIAKKNENYQTILEKVSSELSAASTNFPYLASEYSDNETSKKNNGVIGNFQFSEIREEFKSFVGKMQLGVVSNPIETDEGTYFLLINKFEKGREIPLRETEQELRKKLEQLERLKVYNEYIERLRKNAIIEYYF